MTGEDDIADTTTGDTGITLGCLHRMTMATGKICQCLHNTIAELPAILSHVVYKNSAIIGDQRESEGVSTPPTIKDEDWSASKAAV